MRIHILGINYWPEPTGIGPVTTARAECLAARGHSVTVCVAPPYYPQWRIANGYKMRRLLRERQRGVEILRCPLYVPRTVTPLRRVLHEGTFLLSAFLRSVCAPKPDVLVLVSPPLGLAVAGAALGRWWNVPYLFDVQDLQPDTALDLGMMAPGRVTRALYAVERFAYRRAAVVSTLTDAMRTRIVQKGVPPEKVRRLALWAEPDLFELPHQVGDGAAVRRDLGIGPGFLVLHIGNMGVKQGLDVVLDAARLSGPASHIRYVLVGDGVVRSALQARIVAERLSNVQLLPVVPRAQLLHLLAGADVCLVTQQRTVADIVFPSKVLTLLAAAKPVVASVSAQSEVAKVIQAAGAGLVVPPEDATALVGAIERLREDAGLRREAGERGRAFARAHWQRDSMLETFARTVESMVLRQMPRASEFSPSA